MSAGSPIGVPPGRVSRASSAGRQAAHNGGPSRRHPEQMAGKARSSAAEVNRCKDAIGRSWSRAIHPDFVSIEWPTDRPSADGAHPATSSAAECWLLALGAISRRTLASDASYVAADPQLAPMASGCCIRMRLSTAPRIDRPPKLHQPQSSDRSSTPETSQQQSLHLMQSVVGRARYVTPTPEPRPHVRVPLRGTQAQRAPARRPPAR